MKELDLNKNMDYCIKQAFIQINLKENNQEDQTSEHDIRMKWIIYIKCFGVVSSEKTENVCELQ